MPMTPEEEFEALLDSLPSPEHTPRNPDVVPYLGKKPIKAGAKRAKPKDFTPLVRKFWEERGYQCDRVDGWISVGGMFRKKDFQGCWDVLCTKPNQTPTLIQICARDGLAAHKRKLRSEEPAVDNSRPRIHNVRHMLACGFAYCYTSSTNQEAEARHTTTISLKSTKNS